MAKGDLCYKSGGNALCYKGGGTALVYKGQASPTATIRVPWGPQSYVCNTYDTYHEISFSCSGAFASGSGSIVSQSSDGTETVFKVKVSEGPAVFALSVSTSTPCGAKEEDPGATCRVLAAQRDASPKAKSSVSAPRTESGSSPTVVSVSFDADGKLTGVS